MAVYRSQKGFSLIELLIVVVVALIIGGFAVPSFLQTMRNFRINGDGASINGELLTAKMRAAARFTRTRVYFDLTTRQFRSEWWDKTANAWTLENVGSPQTLASGVTFGTGAVGIDPEGNVATLAGECLDNGGGTITNTACVVFNSRGIPINPATGSPLASDVYVTNGSQVYAVTVSATGLTRIFRTDTLDTGGAHWTRH